MGHWKYEMQNEKQIYYLKCINYMDVYLRQYSYDSMRATLLAEQSAEGE